MMPFLNTNFRMLYLHFFKRYFDIVGIFIENRLNYLYNIKVKNIGCLQGGTNERQIKRII